jgi:hypothetical protein
MYGEAAGLSRPPPVGINDPYYHTSQSRDTGANSLGREFGKLDLDLSQTSTSGSRGLVDKILGPYGLGRSKEEDKPLAKVTDDEGLMRYLDDFQQVTDELSRKIETCKGVIPGQSERERRPSIVY